MKCWIGDVNEHVVECEFVGLLQNEHGDALVVVRPQGYGVMLRTLHPSKVLMRDPRLQESP